MKELTFTDLFKADGHLTRLAQVEFPPVIAVKVSRILRALKPDREPLMEAYRKAFAAHGTEVEPGRYALKTKAQIEAAAKDLDPLFEQALTVAVKERLTVDEMEQARSPITADMLDALWFIIDTGEQPAPQNKLHGGA